MTMAIGIQRIIASVIILLAHQAFAADSQTSYWDFFTNKD